MTAPEPSGRKVRKFTAPPTDKRCTVTVTLRDKSTAQCMHTRLPGFEICAQHAEQQRKWVGP